MYVYDYVHFIQKMSENLKTLRNILDLYKYED